MNVFRRRLARARHEEAGFTLIELLIAASILMALVATMMGTVFSASKTGSTVRQQHDVAQEATVVLNRLTRELREAKQLISVSNPSSPNIASYNPANNVSITFTVDFNADGTIDPLAADPEQLTYTFDVARNRVLMLTPGTTTPVIAAGVQQMTLSFTSKGADWSTLDAVAGGGNNNGVLDDLELPPVDAIQIHVVMNVAGHTQTLDTGVNLRNLTAG